MSRKGSFLPYPEPTLPAKTERHETYLFVLGKRDREMVMIKELLKKTGQRFVWATHEGEPVTPRNCYNADPVIVPNGYTAVLVECEPKQLVGFYGKPRIIDHHRELDPGFGAPAYRYWEASSLGQTWNLLKRRHKRKLKHPCKAYLIASGRDHCRFAAARGECTGISPKEVAEVGRRWIARELGIARSELNERIKRMVEVIDHSPVIQMGNQEVTDLRHVPVDEIYSLAYFGIYEALADLSCAAIIQTGNVAGETDKIVLMGDLVGSTIKHFREVWGPSVGLQDIYGCEVRGHAGGYLPKNLALAA